MSSKSGRGSYAPKGGRGGANKGHPLGPAVRETSIGAARQKMGLPYEPAPPRGFRPGDKGKVVQDPRYPTAGPIDDMTPPRG